MDKKTAAPSIVIMNVRTVRVEVVAADHMLRGHVLVVSGRGTRGRVFVVDPDGVEVSIASRDLREVER